MRKKTQEEKEIRRDARGFKRSIGHFYLILILSAAILMILSPIFNRYLEAYQAVVVAPPKDGKVEIMLQTSMVTTRSIPQALARELKPGDFLEKTRLTWNPIEIPQSALHDDPRIEDPAKQPPVFLPAYYRRYMSTWSGVVTKVEVQKLPTKGLGEKSQRRTMTILLDGGGTQTMEIPKELDGQVRVGTRIEKSARSWEAHVVAQGARVPAEAAPEAPKDATGTPASANGTRP